MKQKREKGRGGERVGVDWTVMEGVKAVREKVREEKKKTLIEKKGINTLEAKGGR